MSIVKEEVVHEIKTEAEINEMYMNYCSNPQSESRDFVKSEMDFVCNEDIEPNVETDIDNDINDCLLVYCSHFLLKPLPCV